ncbi:MAG TPA: hypothetical protein VLF71_01435 [Candidatus Saccharimonadales bacterium]|nr:hypothetical protein [Candidatus Saccharimonadales bacterium]
MNRKLWAGAGLLFLSYINVLVPQEWALANHFAAGFIFTPCIALFVFGVIFLSEGVVQKLGGVSLWSLASGGGWRRYVRFFVVAAVVGCFLEVCAQWLGKLWYYPYYPTWFYWPAFLPSFILYWVMIAESYTAGKALLDRLLHWGGRQKLRYYWFEPALYYVLGACGAGLLLFGLLRAYLDYGLTGGYFFNALSPSMRVPPLHYIIWASVGLWLLCEGVLYVRQRHSLLHSMLHGYAVPALAMVGVALALALVWESQNARVGYWAYQNWPWPGARLFGVQLSVLADWPMNYVLYLLPAASLVPAWAPVFFARPVIAAKERGKGDGRRV